MKVFFLYPNDLIRRELIFPLVEQELEAYAIENHKMVRALSRSHPDSVLFINIDEKLPESDWERFIGNCPLKVGVLSYNDNASQKTKYLSLLNIAAGFHSLRQRPDVLMRDLTTILKSTDSNEKRKSVRTTFPDKSATLQLLYKGISHKGYIRDISSVGMTIVLNKPFRLEKNTLLDNMALVIKESELQLSGIYLGLQRERDDKLLYVVIFDSKVSQATRTRLRYMINRNNREQILERLKPVLV